MLSQCDDAGYERPIAYASRTLGKSERNYAQLDKEGLAVMFGITHFHQYTAGRRVVIFTDHKPLLGIMGNERPLPQMLSPRMLRWCLKLSGYDYELRYRPGSSHQNADMLSRLPLASNEDEQDPASNVLLLEAVNVEPLTAERIAKLTSQDPVLTKVYKGVQTGKTDTWQGEEFKPLRRRKSELSTHRGCVLWGCRVLMPMALRETALKLLHANHLGMSAMKACARSHFWWPNLDSDIEACVRACEICQRHAASPRTADSPTWKRPESPWEVVHMDFAGPVQGVSYLVIVDAYSKWVEVKPMRTTTTSAVLDALRSTFATFGVPRLLFTDNAPNFVSQEMQVFCKRNGISHCTSAPYHPASNGQAERMVGETKRALQKLRQGSVLCRVSRFLYKQHSTVTTTGKTPAELMFGRHWSTVLDAVHPRCDVERMPDNDGKPDNVRRFAENQAVYIRNFTGEPKWIPAVVLQQLGVRSYVVKTSDGTVTRRHVDHIRQRFSQGGEELDDATPTTSLDPVFVFPEVHGHERESLTQESTDGTPQESTDETPPESTDRTPQEMVRISDDCGANEESTQGTSPDSGNRATEEAQIPQRPRRQRRPPDRYGCFVEH